MNKKPFRKVSPERVKDTLDGMADYHTEDDLIRKIMFEFDIARPLALMYVNQWVRGERGGKTLGF